jgi:hypothetical protein
MPELGTSGSVGAAGAQSPAATRPIGWLVGASAPNRGPVVARRLSGSFVACPKVTPSESSPGSLRRP